MTWDEVDFDAATWVIPANRMKMGKIHAVPLRIASYNGRPTFELTRLNPAPEGKIVEHELELIDANHAIQLHPHEWSLDPNKFASPDDTVAAQRRHLMAPTFEGQMARDAERTPT